MFLTLLSCNLDEKIEKMNKINSDLVNEFGHDDINSLHHWGTDDNDNYFQITFYNYNMSEKSYSELEELATEVRKYFIRQDYDFDDLEFIEIRFTKQDKSNADSFVIFK